MGTEPLLNSHAQNAALRPAGRGLCPPRPPRVCAQSLQPEPVAAVSCAAALRRRAAQIPLFSTEEPLQWHRRDGKKAFPHKQICSATTTECVFKIHVGFASQDAAHRGKVDQPHPFVRPCGQEWSRRQLIALRHARPQAEGGLN